MMMKLVVFCSASIAFLANGVPLDTNMDAPGTLAQTEAGPFQKIAKLTANHDYELPALGGLFAGPFGVLPDLDAILNRSRKNLGSQNGVCKLLGSLGMA